MAETWQSNASRTGGRKFATVGGSSATTDLTRAQIDALTPAVGDVAYPTDGAPYVAICRVAGTWQWTLNGDPVTLPVAGDFSDINMGTASVTDRVHLDMFVPNVTPEQLRWQDKTPDSGSFPRTLTVILDSGAIAGESFRGYGVGFRESSSGKLVVLGIHRTDLNVLRFTSPTVSSSVLWGEDRGGMVPLAFRLRETATNLEYYIIDRTTGPDGFLVYTELKDAFFTTGPDSWGWSNYLNDGGVTAPYGVSLMCWEES